MSSDINVLALVKGQERYIFLFGDDSRAEALRIMGRYASDAELSFNWYDAAVLSQKVRKISSATKDQQPAHPRFELPAVDDARSRDEN